MVDCKNAFINSINPKFKNWNRPFTFALVVLVLTLCLTMNIAMTLIHDCPETSKTETLIKLARSYKKGTIAGCIHDLTVVTLAGSGAEGDEKKVVAQSCKPTSLMDTDREDYPQFLKEQNIDFSPLGCDNYCKQEYRDQCKNGVEDGDDSWEYMDCGDYGALGQLLYKDCPSYVSVIGIAFGWASFIEVVVTLLVMVIGVSTGCLKTTSESGVLSEMVGTAKTTLEMA